MRITLVQTAPVWADPLQSRLDAGRLLEESGSTDLIVLPEMFSTGFVTHPEGVAEEDEPESLGWMRDMARKKGCAVAGSIAVRTSEGYRNRFYFVTPDGMERHYDKHHLFTFGGEHLRYTPGDERVVVEYMGWRILLQVCYDLRFPVFSRNRMTGGRPDYDLILYVASWPSSRIEAWDALLKARAIENLCYVAGVNRVGEDPGNSYCGHSTLVSPKGEVLSICKEKTIQFLEYEISKEELDSFRKAFPALLDADQS